MKKNYEWGSPPVGVLKKIMLMTKLTFFLILISVVCVNASVYSQSTKLSLNFEKATINEVLQVIESQTKFRFIYESNKLDMDKEVNLKVTDLEVEKILDHIFDKEEVSYSITESNLILIKPTKSVESNTSLPQQKDIKGKVTEKSGEPLPGVTVVIQGTSQGTVTNYDGEYTLTGVSDNAVLVFSFVGMQKQEVSVEGQATIDIIMLPDAIGIEEVVAIGYGVQKKVDGTGSVASVKMSDMQKITTAQTSLALQGQVAGVNVSQSDAGPGATADIRVRGIGTLSDHFPLVIVDGVPSQMNSVDPRDIESVDVLKDAASAAIYGSRAANGVIIITTKRGKGGVAGKTNITYRAYASFESKGKNFGLISNSADYISLVKTASDNAGTEYPSFVQAWESNPSSFGNTNWEEEYFRSAISQKHEVSIARSGEDFNFYVSGTFNDKEGIRIRSEDKRAGLRVNSDYKKGRIKIGESFSFTRRQGQDHFNSYMFWDMTQATPLHKIYDESTESGFGSGYPEYGFKTKNPLIGYLQNEDSYDYYSILASAYAEIELFKDLKYKFQISQNANLNFGFEFEPEYYTDEKDKNEKSTIYEWSSKKFHNIMDHTLNYNKTFGKHSIAAMVGYSQEKTKYHDFNASARNAADNSLQVIDAHPDEQSAGGEEYEFKLRSQFGRIFYAYDNRYIVQANIRRDGSSRFPEDDRTGVFPSVSMGWRISEEPFFQGVDKISNLKLRASYGTLGMQEVGNYSYIPEVASNSNKYTNYPYGTGPTQDITVGARVTKFPSVGLKWEETKTTNFGFDVGFFKSKLTLEADYYIKQVEDILYKVQIPLSAGSADSPPVNSASIDNKGFELAVSWKEYEKPFKFDATLTVASNKNEVVKLGRTGEESIVGGDLHWSFNNVTRTTVGSELGEFYLFDADGIFKSQAEVDAYKNAAGEAIMASAEPGDVKIIDTNGDGTITDDDKIYMGSGLPKAELGLTFNASYKNFDANVFFHSLVGTKKINGGKWLSYRADDWHGFHEDLLDSWSTQNSDSNIPRMVASQSHMNYREHDYWLEDASYLRLKHLELGYTVPKSLLADIGISNVRIYVAGENLFTITGYSGWDPAGTGGGSFASGVDRYPYPVAKQFVTGIEINF